MVSVISARAHARQNSPPQVCQERGEKHSGRVCKTVIMNTYSQFWCLPGSALPASTRLSVGPFVPLSVVLPVAPSVVLSVGLSVSAVQPVCLAVALSPVLSVVFCAGLPVARTVGLFRSARLQVCFVVISICVSIFGSVCGSVCKAICGLDVALSVIYSWGQLKAEQRLVENVRWISSWSYRPVAGQVPLGCWGKSMSWAAMPQTCCSCTVVRHPVECKFILECTLKMLCRWFFPCRLMEWYQQTFYNECLS